MVGVERPRMECMPRAPTVTRNVERGSGFVNGLFNGFAAA